MQSLKPGSFFGSRTASRPVVGATLVESQYRGGLSIPFHTHEAPYFSLVIEGRYVETVGSASRSCTPRHALFHPSGERHANRFESRPGTLFMVEPSESWLKYAADYQVRIDRPLECRGGPLWWLLSQIHREFSKWDEVTPLVIEGLLLEIAGAAKRRFDVADRRPPRWLERCREHMLACFAHSLRLSHVAAAEGVHPVQLAREFRRFYGCTAGDYLRRIRVETACRRLKESNDALCQIGFECGFASQSHFSSAFRRIVGLTPAAYRKLGGVSSIHENAAKP